MINLEKQINDAINDNSEFNFLNNFNLYCTEETLNEFHINMCLDIYNKLIDKQIKYFAKYDALRLTGLYIINEKDIKVK